ncbi:Nuclear transport factor 2 [Desmophyllum pertusum]|uniref:Nuclear transport factor 2 n=1 Tax=Desmophyllum pertusum TaxID=174260 RepID=A0A9X0A2N2_9CNID|nr:Nuclear transport factor 2 [Desmophyllum pertusum]
MNPNFASVGQEFATLYYQVFDSNRAALESLYNANSMLTFEGEQFQGTAAIIKKLTELPFKTVKHVITTIDCQPTTSTGVIVFVVGQLKTDNDPPHSFSQCFHLQPKPDSPTLTYYVFNDMFRLSLHHG